MNVENDIAKKLSNLTTEAYPLFAGYCNLIDRGERKKALQVLDAFLNSTIEWKLEEKIGFCNIIFDSDDWFFELSSILTWPISERLIKPTLVNMATREPGDHKAFLWYGHFYGDQYYLKRAWELKPSEVRVQASLLKNLEYHLWASTHHLPWGYDKNGLLEDKNDVALANRILDITTDDLRQKYAERMKEIETELKEYEERQKG